MGRSVPRLRAVIFDWGGTLTPLSNTIWVPHSEIPVAQQVSVDVTPDGVAHELLDVLDIVDGWHSR